MILTSNCSYSGRQIRYNSISTEYDIEINNVWVPHPIKLIANFFEEYAKEFNADIQVDWDYVNGGLTFNGNANAIKVPIIVKYSDITIINEYGNSMPIGDFYVIMRVSIEGVYLYGYRPHVSYKEVQAKYIHSHIETCSYRESIGMWDFPFCTGNSDTQVNLATSDIRNNFLYSNMTGAYKNSESLLSLADACYNLLGVLRPLLETESIKGGPYIYMDTVKYSGEIRPKGYADNAVCRGLFKQIVQRVDENEDLEFNISDGYPIILNTPSLKSFIHKYYPSALTIDIGHSECELDIRYDPSEGVKTSIADRISGLYTPFKWDGAKIQYTVTSRNYNLNIEELYAKSQINSAVYLRINQLFKQQFVSSLRLEGSQATITQARSEAESSNIRQNLEENPPIPYTTS